MHSFLSESQTSGLEREVSQVDGNFHVNPREYIFRSESGRWQFSW